ncbi:prolyl-tRNA synthetase associated domain-containing protein [Marivibrio halodurans]|uniref:Prolyl-tRNA synthetase associated domain-containing protein n=1 Tax=Marivibrio halodurans TaxID=2039722 RepID=A0A8J7V391_9PROT|nr:prolyl-tRNA synthetase associated domain-containing protein [Marivibrio halodurans]MBP5857981.1 prolyl-tRNA synthetase associated domain-containing protein [Marivibrio halodurans]
MAKGEADLLARLDALGIAHETVAHEPVFTVEESQALRGQLDGAHVKNMFLRDKKKRLWLVTVLEDRAVDLKALKKRIGAQGSLSFGDADLLMAVVGVSPGSVTPFGVINDAEKRLTVVLDAGIFGHGTVNAHPLRNDKTTRIAAADLKRFIAAEGYEAEIVDFGAPLAPEE